MRVLIINADYPAFLEDLYERDSSLSQRTYEEQYEARAASLFGVADFYSKSLQRLGHRCAEVFVNNHAMQFAWAKEQGLRPIPRTGMIARLPDRARFRLAKLMRTSPHPRWMYEILRGQIEEFKPDVLINQAMDMVDCDYLRTDKEIFVVGQHAAGPLGGYSFHRYDLLVSSSPATLDFFRRATDAPAVLQHLAFEPRVLEAAPPAAERHSITFVGSLYDIHSSRQELLESIAGEFPDLAIWAPRGQVPPSLASFYRGPAWGIEMYRILAASDIVLNHHGNVPFANNLRLFEGTGIGSFLLTDWKPNLELLFQIGDELVAYRTNEECLELIDIYRRDAHARATIAARGQKRTLTNHTYDMRMQELVSLIERMKD